MCSFWCSFFFFSSRRRHTRCSRDWSSDVCSSDLGELHEAVRPVADGGEATLRQGLGQPGRSEQDRKSTRLNSSHGYISYAVFCLKKKRDPTTQREGGDDFQGAAATRPRGEPLASA